MTIRIDSDMQLNGDTQNPNLCLRFLFPTCTGFKQQAINRRKSDIEIFRGDDLQITFDVIDESGLEVAIDKTQNLKFWIAVNNDSTPVIVKERQKGGVLFSGGIIVMGDDHRFQLQIDAVDTEDLTPGTYYWECQIVTDNLKTVTGAFGNFKVKRDLIRTENEPA